MEHKAGYVNIIGNPNVGKSTLMNALVGERLSIITSKAQTTRHRILGIVNDEQHQIIFSPKVSKKDTRPILEAVIDFNGKPIHFYNVHFPAPYNPIGMRKDAFNTLKNITSSHSNAVIALGDFNVTSFEADKNKTFVSLDKDWDISHIAGCSNCLGSHYYRRDDNWSFLDVIIIKENRGISFKNESINVLKTNINTNKEGKPLSFNMNNGEGVSDHLPVIATISIN